MLVRDLPPLYDLSSLDALDSDSIHFHMLPCGSYALRVTLVRSMNAKTGDNALPHYLGGRRSKHWVFSSSIAHVTRFFMERTLR